MMTLKDIKKDQDLINAIDWDMTPEEAVRLYLEWGNNWAGGNYVIRSKSDVTHYFMISTWEQTPEIYLIRRNSADYEELARIGLPESLARRFSESTGGSHGIYALEGEIKNWLKRQLAVA